MAATFIGAANSPTSGETHASTHSVTKPAGAQIAVFFITTWNYSGTITPAASAVGATLRNNTAVGTARTTTYIKYINGDATGATYTFNLASAEWSALKAIFYDGVDTGLDLATVPFNTANASSSNYPSTSVSLSSGGALAWHGNSIDYSSGSAHTPPTSFTEVGDSLASSTAYRIAPSTGTQTASGATYGESTTLISTLAGLAPAAGGGATDLVIQDATISMVADSPTFTQTHILAVQDAILATIADSPSLIQSHNLAIQDGVLVTTSDNLTLNQAIALDIQAATMSVVADNMSLTQVHQLVIHDAFLQLAADIVQFAIQGGAVPTVSDIQKEKLEVLTASSGLSLNDLLHKYYGGLSGLTPVAAFSVTDHQRAYWLAQTGADNFKSMADLERLFYDTQLVPSGSLADREYVYWSGL